jgi:hypothetical protein
MNFSMKLSAYLNKKAEKWVSLFVLFGCAAITASLLFLALKADALGDRLGNAANVDINSL